MFKGLSWYIYHVLYGLYKAVAVWRDVSRSRSADPRPFRRRLRSSADSADARHSALPACTTRVSSKPATME